MTLTANSQPNEVVAVAASYDQTLKYGAQTPFSDQLAAHWVGSQWEYDPQHDSIVTTGNGSSQPTQAAFTIFYNQGTEKYELDQSLQPGEQMWVDIGKLIREAVPDKNGKTLPADLASGSYAIRDLTNDRVPRLFEGKVIYDKTYGHVVYGCAACCGWTDPISLWYDPIDIIIEALQNDGVFAWYPCGSFTDDVSSSFYGGWSSNNTSIVTVDTYGTHSGISVGSTTTAAFGSIQGNDAHRNCPLINPNPGGGANTTPTVVIQGNPTHVYIGSDPTIAQINALFSQGTPNGGAYTWSTPDSTTSFDNVNAQDVHVTATNYTGKTNDTQLTVNYSYNGVGAAPASVMVTKLIFERLCCDSLTQVASFSGQTYNGQPTWGYIFQASYNVIANPGSVQISDGSGVSTNEQVTQTSGNVNITPNIGQGALTTNSQLLDYPMAILSNSPLPSNLSIVDSQDLFVGSLYVRNNTLTWTSTGVTVTNNGPTS